MYGLVSISPENIAYAAVVARFSLSSKRIWNLKVDHFDYRTFYQAIILRLTDREDPWVQDTLAWWNERVFGNERGKVFAAPVWYKDQTTLLCELHTTQNATTRHIAGAFS